MSGPDPSGPDPSGPDPSGPDPSGPDPSGPRRIVVMGVSGTGKSRIGALLANALRLPFLEGDELHPRRNVAKLAAGIPLDDRDRAPWLSAIADAIRQRPFGCVATCSALKRQYRELLRERVPGTWFVHLAATAPVLAGRIGGREGHFMPVSLLGSQLATLQPLAVDEPGVTIDTDARGVPEVLRAALTAISAAGRPACGPDGVTAARGSRAGAPRAARRCCATAVPPRRVDERRRCAA